MRARAALLSIVAATMGCPHGAEVDFPASDGTALEPIGRAEPVSGPANTEILIGEPGDGHRLEGRGRDRARRRTPRRERLYLVADAPYQSWANEGTYVHLLALTPEFRPASGAKWAWTNAGGARSSGRGGGASQRGTATVDRHGLVTLEGVRVGKEGNRITVGR